MVDGWLRVCLVDSWFIYSFMDRCYGQLLKNHRNMDDSIRLMQHALQLGSFRLENRVVDSQVDGFSYWPVMVDSNMILK